LDLHCDELLEFAAADRFTILVGYVGGHGGSSEELAYAFPLILYTANKNQKQQVEVIIRPSLDPWYEMRGVVALVHMKQVENKIFILRPQKWS
jgi:hypothetical protein